MFGPKLRIEYDGLAVTLAPPSKEQMAGATDMMSSLMVGQYTTGGRGYTAQDEESWFERVRTSGNSEVVWGIYVEDEGKKTFIGSTSIDDIDSIGGCSTGIIIFDQKWWNRGVAGHAHLIRTWFAANMKARLTIHSAVRTENIASLKALQRVGYTITGVTPRNCYVDGHYLDTYRLTWIHPDPNKISILYPEGLPPEFQEGVNLAQQALNKASELVQLL